MANRLNNVKGINMLRAYVILCLIMLVSILITGCGLYQDHFQKTADMYKESTNEVMDKLDTEVDEIQNKYGDASNSKLGNTIRDVVK